MLEGSYVKIKGSSQLRKSKKRICIRCGKEFLPCASRQKYCSDCKIAIFREQIKEQKEERKINSRIKYYATENGKEVNRRAYANRHGLGYKTLNEYFMGCAGHHIDKKYVIHIPKEMHRSVWHCLESRKGMDEINVLAIRFLIDEGGAL